MPRTQILEIDFTNLVTFYKSNSLVLCDSNGLKILLADI